MPLIFFKRCAPKDFRQLPARRAAQQIHLPKTVAGGDVALGEIQVFFIRRFDVRDAALVPPNRDDAMKSRESNSRRFQLCAGGRGLRGGALGWQQDTDNAQQKCQTESYVLIPHKPSLLIASLCMLYEHPVKTCDLASHWFHRLRDHRKEPIWSGHP